MVTAATTQILYFPQSQCGNDGKLPPNSNFREINLQYNSLVKKLLWRNFCKKSWGKNFQISTLWRVTMWLSKISRKQRFLSGFHLLIHLWNYSFANFMLELFFNDLLNLLNSVYLPTYLLQCTFSYLFKKFSRNCFSHK